MMPVRAAYEVGMAAVAAAGVALADLVGSWWDSPLMERYGGFFVLTVVILFGMKRIGWFIERSVSAFETAIEQFRAFREMQHETNRSILRSLESIERRLDK